MTAHKPQETSRQRRRKELRETLQDYAIRAIPDDFDPWPAMESRILTIAATSPEAQVPARTMRPIEGAQTRGLKVSLAMLSVLLVSVAAAGVAIFVGIKPAQPSAGGDSDFVPAGKVRHIVIERRLEGDASKVSDVLRPVTGTIEAWYSNGPKSMLQHVFYNDYDAQTGKTKRSEVWVEEGTMYTQVLEKKVVLWQAWPYDPVYAPNPNLARDLLQQPNSRVISDTVIDGRNTLVISWPDSSGENQWWIDKDTNRAYRWQVILAQDTTPGSGDFSTISIEEIVVDEVVGADTLPPDFFRFKLPEGFRLVEREMPPPHSSPGTVTP